MPDSGVRRRDAAATRAAILAAARATFAARGYDGAGLREIAAGAGVTAMMIGRYFGSKENLFAEVVAASMADPVILAPGNIAAADMAERFAAALVDLTASGAGPLDGFLILFRSASSPVAARIAREQIAAIHLRAATATASGPDAETRAALFLALVAGFQMMRQMIGLAALADADRDRLVAILTPLIAGILAPPSSLIAP
jgi:AcrR family transcriptional regulator